MNQNLKVFKFGGASLRDVENIKNVAAILQKFSTENLVIIVSAMGKTTNALEEVVRAYFRRDTEGAEKILTQLRHNHDAILDALFDKNADVYAHINDIFVEIEWVLEDEPHDTFDYVYDQIVGTGELLSSRIVASYLQSVGLKTTWLDARDVLRTDETWREAVIDWKTTTENTQNTVKPMLNGGGFVLTQGFISSTKDNNTTTLGREGSDYSAAIFAHCLDAEAMFIWKDVPGVLSGDPRVFKDVVKLDKIGYAEAVEMTYYGATVVHPRTIQPLMAKNIPLHVRSFVDHNAPGTIIGVEENKGYPPILMAERNQVFMQFSTKDFMFIVESHIRDIFATFAKHGVFVNFMQNSGAYFFISITRKAEVEADLLADLRTQFNVELTDNLDLFTVRHPTPSVLEGLKTGRKVIFDKTTPQTYQVILG